MLRLSIVVLVAFSALCFGSTPLYEAKHYKTYISRDGESRLDTIHEQREFQVESEGYLRTIIETPTNDQVPQDSGSPLFGDIEFSITRKDGELLIRDTIVNQVTDQNVYIYYNRTLPGYYVEDMRLFNVGRQRGFVGWAHIAHNDGFVESELSVPANNTVRIFVEIYVRVED